ncbi:MAG: transporter substrate-binding domain-containing protein [Phormidesmis sp.]
MKRRWFLAGFALSFANAGCRRRGVNAGNSESVAVPAEAGAALSDTQVGRNDKTLVMATTPNYPPYEQIADGQTANDPTTDTAPDTTQDAQIADPIEEPLEDGLKDSTIVGFDIDLAKLIADRLGRQLEVVDLSFDALIPALVDNKVDIAMAALEPNRSRKQLVDFSNIYYRARHMLVSVGGYLRSRDLSYQTIGVRSGSVQARFAQKLTNGEIPGLNIEAYDSLEQLFIALDTGEIEGAIVEANLAGDYLSRYPDFDANVMATEEATGSAIALAKNSPLRRDINAALSQIKASGEMDQLIARWFD